jgi:hypothetical protein
MYLDHYVVIGLVGGIAKLVWGARLITITAA